MPLPSAHIFDTDGAALLDQHAGGLRLGDDGEVFARRRRVQIGAGRAPAFAVLLRHLKEAAAELHGAVEVRVEWNADLLRCFDEDVA